MREIPGAIPDRMTSPDRCSTSGRSPLATAQEISLFVRRSLERDCDYALGLVTEESMRAFDPESTGGPGIRMA